MKYLSIYEKFDSPIISNTIKFLSKTIDKFQSERFIEILKEKLENINFPISKLEDSDIMYLKKDKALKIKKDNPTDLDYLKFWFSIEKGCLFTTGTGALTLSKKSKDELNIITDNTILNEIKKCFPTGIARPITDYSKIKHLDKVVGIFNNSAYDKFILATIWLEDDQIYAIQNEKLGGSPNYGNWRDYGRGSWILGDSVNISIDHHFLHFYEENDKPLKIINPESNKEISVYDYNLLYEYGGKLNNKISMEEEFKKADFALVISVQDLLDKNYNTKDIAKSRIESRTGALHLIDDETLRKINIQRYTKGIFKKFGISDESLDLNNLEKMITKLIMRELCFYNIICNDNHLTYIKNITDSIKKILTSNQPFDIKNEVKRIFNYYEAINMLYDNYYNKTKSSIKYIKNHAKENEKPTLVEILDIFDRISYKIYNSINEDKISNVYDFSSYVYKLNTLYTMFNEHFGNKDIRRLFSDILNSDLELYLYYISEEDCKKDIEKAKSIERYVNKTFL